ncbi:hypothetical protein CYMTET_49817 [Cymbomonas tetramitiformis]|uniref:3-dehydroquinate synthase C-terminal domain-containing protein n=1 Tax=Cymbomonas tetramitiformis TaxID=36881 RepID=A0AAE0EUC1_9CHLO|nr:hypothetical protein CYMTET_49817 [Cymbomonas tetramitiformis]
MVWESLVLEVAKVTRVEPMGVGDRACVDLACLLEPGEGILVGSFARALFLVHSECMPSDYVASRPFRVNAGPVHSYTSGVGGRTAYLAELRTGSQGYRVGWGRDVVAAGQGYRGGRGGDVVAAGQGCCCGGWAGMSWRWVRDVGRLGQGDVVGGRAGMFWQQGQDVVAVWAGMSCSWGGGMSWWSGQGCCSARGSDVVAAGARMSYAVAGCCGRPGQGCLAAGAGMLYKLGQGYAPRGSGISWQCGAGMSWRPGQGCRQAGSGYRGGWCRNVVTAGTRMSSHGAGDVVVAEAWMLWQPRMSWWPGRDVARRLRQDVMTAGAGMPWWSGQGLGRMSWWPGQRCRGGWGKDVAAVGAGMLGGGWGRDVVAAGAGMSWRLGDVVAAGAGMSGGRAGLMAAGAKDVLGGWGRDVGSWGRDVGGSGKDVVASGQGCRKGRVRDVGWSGDVVVVGVGMLWWPGSDVVAVGGKDVVAAVVTSGSHKADVMAAGAGMSAFGGMDVAGRGRDVGQPGSWMLQRPGQDVGRLWQGCRGGWGRDFVALGQGCRCGWGRDVAAVGSGMSLRLGAGMSWWSGRDVVESGAGMSLRLGQGSRASPWQGICRRLIFGGSVLRAYPIMDARAVTVVDHAGNQRLELVGRVKIERRPMLLIEAETVDGVAHSCLLQNAETVRLIGPGSAPSGPAGHSHVAHDSGREMSDEWAAIPITTLQVGDTVLVHKQVAARHTGIALDGEAIIER